MCGCSARNRAADTTVAVGAPNSKVNLSLGAVMLVQGTNVIRADLIKSEGSGSLSSKSGYEVRNILFIEPGEKAARWLLTDNDHRLMHSTDIRPEVQGSTRSTGVEATAPLIATVVLVESPQYSENPVGRLLLFDPTGKKVTEIADNVRRIDLAAFFEGHVRVLYEQNRKLVLTGFDPDSLAKLAEQQVEIPQLR